MSNIWIWLVVIAVAGSVGFTWYQSVQTPASYVELKPVDTLEPTSPPNVATSTATTTVEQPS